MSKVIIKENDKTVTNEPLFRGESCHCSDCFEINGIIKKYKVNRGKSVSVGDFVEFANRYNTGVFEESGSVSYVSACKLDETRVLIAYNDDLKNCGTIGILEVTKDGITAGEKSIFCNTTVAWIDVALVTNNKIALVYNSTIKLCTIENLNICEYGTALSVSHCWRGSPKIIVLSLSQILLVHGYQHWSSSNQNGDLRWSLIKITNNQLSLQVSKEINFVKWRWIFGDIGNPYETPMEVAATKINQNESISTGWLDSGTTTSSTRSKTFLITTNTTSLSITVLSTPDFIGHPYHIESLSNDTFLFVWGTNSGEGRAAIYSLDRDNNKFICSSSLTFTTTLVTNPKSVSIVRINNENFILVYSDLNKTGTHYDRFVFSNGTEVKVVHRHRFYNMEEQAFVHLDTWYKGDHAFCIDGSVVELTEKHIRDYTGKIKHYTIFCEHNTYFANGILCGNRYSDKLNLGDAVCTSTNNESINEAPKQYYPFVLNFQDTQSSYTAAYIDTKTKDIMFVKDNKHINYHQIGYDNCYGTFYKKPEGSEGYDYDDIITNWEKVADLTHEFIEDNLKDKQFNVIILYVERPARDTALTVDGVADGGGNEPSHRRIITVCASSET